MAIGITDLKRKKSNRLEGIAVFVIPFIILHSINRCKMYFPETTKLLFEPDFNRFLASVNELYLIDTDLQACIVQQDSGFDITLERWFEIVKAYPYFKEVAVKHAKTDFVNKDWEVFNSEIHEIANNSKLFNDKADALHKEIEVLKSKILDKDFLKPISLELVSMLDRVINQYKEYNMSKSSKLGINTNVEPLRWNGGVASLATLFHDLRTTKGSNDKVYLDYVPKQLMEFLLQHFVDENGDPFSPSSVSKYIDPKQKKAKKDRVDISLIEEDTE